MIFNSCSAEWNVTKTSAEIADAASYHAESCTSLASETSLTEIAVQRGFSCTSRCGDGER